MYSPCFLYSLLHILSPLLTRVVWRATMNMRKINECITIIIGIIIYIINKC